MKTAEIIFPAVVFLFLGVLLALGTFVFDYGPVVMRFPYLVGGFTMMMCVIVITARLRGGDGLEEPALPPEAEAQGVSMPEEEKIPLRDILRAALWLLGILPVVYICGYLAGIPLYLLAYLREHGESWVLSIVIAAVMAALIYFVFMKILLVPIPVMPFTAFG